MTAKTWTEEEHAELRRQILHAAQHGPNPVAAASLMFEALDRAWDAPTAREGLVDNFTGRLLDRLLRVVGEPPSTDREQRGAVMSPVVDEVTQDANARLIAAALEMAGLLQFVLENGHEPPHTAREIADLLARIRGAA